MVSVIVVSYNTTLFNEVLKVIPLTENLGFAIAVVGFLLGITGLVISAVCVFLGERATLALLIIVSAVVKVLFAQYRIPFDEVMWINVFETSTQESWELLNASLLWGVFLYGVLPAVLIYRWWPTSTDWRTHFQQQTIHIGAFFGLAIGSIFIDLGQFETFAREHRKVRVHINPVYPVYSLLQAAAHKWHGEQSHPFQRLVDKVSPLAEPGERHLMILVVGETARWDRFGINGYHRNTTPYLFAMSGLTVFDRVQSCGTSTAVSVPCMFSLYGKDDFELKEASYTQNVLDVLQSSGVSVLWRDNNSSSKHVADRVEYQNFKKPELNPICDIECRDEGLLAGLDDWLQQQPGDALIVLHQMGSHGPNYWRRYPKAFEVFTPVCQQSDLTACSMQEVNNAYDNTILYTDYVLEKIRQWLVRYQQEYQTAFVYVSDHGESLGENGVYLHGMPYFMAPDEQLHVPMLLWQPSASKDVSIKRNDTPLSHDNLTPTLLDFFKRIPEQNARVDINRFKSVLELEQQGILEE
jgi:lipid A ethanolaminephosphotransferase